MLDESPIQFPELNVKFSRDEFRTMVPLSADRPHFVSPMRRIGGEPRVPDVFNNLTGVQDIAQFDPEEFKGGRPVHFMLMVKAPGCVKHKVPNLHMPQVSYMALQRAMDYHALTHGEERVTNSWAKLEFLRRWIEPDEPGHPGNGNFKPVRNHTDEGPHRYQKRQGIASSNYALRVGPSTRHVAKPFSEVVTGHNILSQFDHMAQQREYYTRPSGRLVAWAGHHPHAAGINQTDQAILGTFMWLSYTDGVGEDDEINVLARKNPVLRI